MDKGTKKIIVVSAIIAVICLWLVLVIRQYTFCFYDLLISDGRKSEHDEKGTRNPMIKERKMIERVKELWYDYNNE